VKKEGDVIFQYNSVVAYICVTCLPLHVVRIRDFRPKLFLKYRQEKFRHHQDKFEEHYRRSVNNVTERPYKVRLTHKNKAHSIY